MYVRQIIGHIGIKLLLTRWGESLRQSFLITSIAANCICSSQVGICSAADNIFSTAFGKAQLDRKTRAFRRQVVSVSWKVFISENVTKELDYQYCSKKDLNKFGCIRYQGFKIRINRKDRQHSVFSDI